MIHYDLFSGIGGFSLAVGEVWHDQPVEHIFCEWDQFCTAVLKQHWPDAEYWGDIAELVTYTEGQGLQQSRTPRSKAAKRRACGRRLTDDDLCIVTGGFPCQPFSAAGRRRGTADDRYKWPEMFAIIKNVRPDWVVAENVRGLVTWSKGLVLEQVCTDLEGIGYEVQPLIIPACAVNAPHRRDRVWIIANRPGDRRQRRGQATAPQERYAERHEQARQLAGRPEGSHSDDADPVGSNTNGGIQREVTRQPKRGVPAKNLQRGAQPDWTRDWVEVALTTCDGAMDDGLPRIVDGVPISRAKWRKESLKAFGNAIVPQVAVEIMRAIREANQVVDRPN